MDVVDGLLLTLGLLVILVWIAWSWRERREHHRQLEALQAELRMSREAAARQLLELRQSLSQAERDAARAQALHDEVRRLRDKLRRLHAHHLSVTGADETSSQRLVQEGLGPDTVPPDLPPIIFDSQR